MTGRKKGRPPIGDEEKARRKVEGLRLRDRRLRARLTQADLAALLACSERTVSDWEGGMGLIWPTAWEELELQEARNA